MLLHVSIDLRRRPLYIREKNTKAAAFASSSAAVAALCLSR
jgi:hypothetical protein